MKKIVLLFIAMMFISCLGQSKQSTPQQKEKAKEYTVFIKEVIAKRDTFQLQYESATAKKRKDIVKKARLYIVKTVATELFPYWYGTKWDFNGTTRTPQKGRIACGYFVTNTLTDVGFNIPRIKWAQSASEVFIKKLAKKEIKRFTNTSIIKVEEYLKNSGNGLYLVGLDSHTGFIYVHEGEVRFVHADYYEPEKGVVSEKLNSFSPIADSKYRVIGKLMSDEMIVSWMLKKKIN